MSNPNPDWQDPNRNVSDSSIHKRVFDYDNDAYRVNVVEPIELEVGDIQIGAVEIKDSITDERANVVSIGDKNGIITQNLIEQTKTSVNSFGSAIVSPGLTVTLATYTIASDKAFTFIGGIVGGDESGEFHFEVGGSDIALVRNSGSQRSIIVNFPESQKVGASTVINIKVKNLGNKTKQFEATLSGYLLPI